MSLKQQLIKSFMGVGIMKFLSLPIGLTTSVILARIMGPESFGQYVFIMALIPIIALPVSGGLQQLLTREVANYKHGCQWPLYKGVVEASHGWVFIISALLLLGYYVIGPLLGWVTVEGRWSIFSIAIWLVPLLGFSVVRIGIIKGLGKPVIAEFPQQLIYPISMLMIVAFLATFNVLGLESAVWSNIISALLTFCIASYLLKKSKPINISHVEPAFLNKAWLKSLLPFTLLTAINLLNVQVGILLLGVLSSDEQVAALRIAERGGQLVLLSLTMVNMVIAPHIVRAYRENNLMLLQKMAQRTARGAFFFALPIALVLAFAGRPIISMVFGADYSNISYWPLAILVVGQLVNVFFGSVGYLLVMTGNERDSLKGQCVALILNFSFALALIPLWGAVGASVAIMVSIVVWNVLLVILVNKRLNIRCSAFWW